MSKENNKVKINDEKLSSLKVTPIVAPENLKSNQVYIENYGVLTIKPTKLKYFIPIDKNSISMYNGALMIKEIGYHQLFSLYSDAKIIVENLIKAIFDIDEIDFFDELTSRNLIDIINIANEINEVKTDDFLLMEKIEKVENVEENKTESKKE